METFKNTNFERSVTNATWANDMGVRYTGLGLHESQSFKHLNMSVKRKKYQKVVRIDFGRYTYQRNVGQLIYTRRL